ncbi:MAG: O-antigen ligase family protein [Rhizomicrobium sp.]
MQPEEAMVATDWLFLLIAFWFGSYLYLFAFEKYELKPLYSYFVLIGLAGVHVLWSVGREASPSRRGSGIAGLYCWLAVYLGYGILEYLRSPQDEVTTQALIDLGEAVVLATAFTAFLRKPELLRNFSFLFCLIALVGSCVNCVDFVTPMLSLIPGRAAGFYGNPNIAGIAIALAMMGGIEAVARRLRLPYLIFCGLGVLLTVSRESWLAWAVGALLLALTDIRSRGRRLWSVALILGTAFLATLFFQGSLKDDLMQTPVAQYLTPDTATRIGIGGALFEDESAMERKALLNDSLHEAELAPWTGRGLGFTQEWNYRVGPHDMYLLFFVEGGVPGLALFVALMALVWVCAAGTGRIVAAQFFVASLFSHNLLDQPAFVMVIAYVLAHGDASRWSAARSSDSHVPFRAPRIAMSRGASWP